MPKPHPLFHSVGGRALYGGGYTDTRSEQERKTDAARMSYRATYADGSRATNFDRWGDEKRARARANEIAKERGTTVASFEATG